jgi:hypothetical protein
LPPHHHHITDLKSIVALIVSASFFVWSVIHQSSSLLFSGKYLNYLPLYKTILKTLSKHFNKFKIYKNFKMISFSLSSLNSLQPTGDSGSFLKCTYSGGRDQEDLCSKPASAKNPKTLSQKYPTHKRPGGMTQVIECLLSKHEGLS